MIKEYIRKDGSKAYLAQVYLGIDSVTGKKKSTTRRGFANKKEAEIMEARLKVNSADGVHTTLTKQRYRFSDVYELWLQQHEREVKPGSYGTTKRYAELHVLPYFGNLFIEKIDVAFCQKILNKWTDHFKSAKYPKRIVSETLNYALLMGIIDTNPMKLLKLPRQKKEQPMQQENYLDSDELKYFLECCEDYGNEKFTTFFRLLAFTGCRRGEALALTWNDIHFKSKRITISKTQTVDEDGIAIVSTPKTFESYREISIDKKTADMLMAWRSAQRKLYFKRGINTSSKEQLVFTTYPENKLYNGPTVNDWLNTIERKYKLKHITIHGFRHTHCSLLFEAGTPIQVVKERLGHSNINTTMNIYTHVTKKAEENAAEKFAERFNF